jgi:hypothetical protein
VKRRAKTAFNRVASTRRSSDPAASGAEVGVDIGTGPHEAALEIAGEGLRDARNQVLNDPLRPN